MDETVSKAYNVSYLMRIFIFSMTHSSLTSILFNDITFLFDENSNLVSVHVKIEWIYFFLSSKLVFKSSLKNTNRLYDINFLKDINYPCPP